MSTYEGPNRIRTSDAEREEIVTVLRAAMGEGRLTLDEGEERIANAYATKFRDELGPLTNDLPGAGRPAAFNTPEARAEWAARSRRRFGRHVGMVTVVTIVLIGLWLLSGAHFFWPLIPLIFLFFGVFRHAAWQRYGYYQRYRNDR